MNSKTIKFTKAQALGNDFIIADGLSGVNVQNLIDIADRRLGVGCDQFISFEDNNNPKTDFTIRFYNSDGSHAGACGNGSRAVAGYYAQKTGKKAFSFAVEQSGGQLAILHAKILDEHCALLMEKPKFSSQSIPLSGADINPQAVTFDDLLDISGFCVNVGNPHIVFIVPDVNDIDVAKWGQKIEYDALFPERVNVEFVQITNRRNIIMRVWERGTGITKACGTGACASAIAAITKGLCDADVNVHCDGGMMQVHYDTQSGTLMLSGAYKIVFTGEIPYDD